MLPGKDRVTSINTLKDRPSFCRIGFGKYNRRMQHCYGAIRYGLARIWSALSSASDMLIKFCYTMDQRCLIETTWLSKLSPGILKGKHMGYAVWTHYLKEGQILRTSIVRPVTLAYGPREVVDSNGGRIRRSIPLGRTGYLDLFDAGT